MIYFVSSAAIIVIFLLMRKTEEKLHLIKSIVLAIGIYVCYLCLLAGIYTILTIPVNIYSVSFSNIILFVLGIVFLLKTKYIQQYYFDWFDFQFICVLILLTFTLWQNRFTNDISIIFQTSDPAVHLQMAMNFVNSESVDGMYIGQLINGLFIESMMNVYQGAFVYKSFIIQYFFNFTLSGLMFWAAVQNLEMKGIAGRMLVYLVTAIYILGYPYNEMLYGYVYLQLAITVICLIAAAVQEYLFNKVDLRISSLILLLGCFGVSIGYTLFAPPVYIAVFVCVIYKAYKEGWLLNGKRRFFSVKFILFNLRVFILPVFLTLWFLIILPNLASGGTGVTDYGNVLTLEGAIYRNLYFDFAIWLVPALFGYINSIISKNISLFTFLTPVLFLYAIVFFFKMINGSVSTYYYYKFNYLFWMVVLVLFLMGIVSLYHTERLLFGCIIFGIASMYFVNSSNIENKLQEKNIDIMPYTDAQAFFRVNRVNEHFEIYPAYPMPFGLIEISKNVYERDNAAPIVFIGEWQDLLWYEALTNQRFNGLNHYSFDQQLEKFKSGEFGEYAIIMKNIEKTEWFNEYIYNHQVCETDYAYIIKNDEHNMTE